MKVVDYVVTPSCIFPDTTIWCGTFKKKKNGDNWWMTRRDVTNMVCNSFLEHYVAKTEEELKGGKGMEFSFNNVKGYDVTIRITKRVTKE